MSNLQNIQEHGNGDSEVVKFAVFASVYVPGKKGVFLLHKCHPVLKTRKFSIDIIDLIIS